MAAGGPFRVPGRRLSSSPGAREPGCPGGQWPARVPQGGKQTHSLVRLGFHGVGVGRMVQMEVSGKLPETPWGRHVLFPSLLFCQLSPVLRPDFSSAPVLCARSREALSPGRGDGANARVLEAAASSGRTPEPLAPTAPSVRETASISNALAAGSGAPRPGSRQAAAGDGAVTGRWAGQASRP